MIQWDEPHAVYRVYDSAELLVYVGLSQRPEIRIAYHRSSALWRTLISRWTEEWYPDRREAAKAEQAAIDLELPYCGMTTDLYREVSSICRHAVSVDGKARAVRAARERYREAAIAFQVAARTPPHPVSVPT